MSEESKLAIAQNQGGGSGDLPLNEVSRRKREQSWRGCKRWKRAMGIERYKTLWSEERKGERALANLDGDEIKGVLRRKGQLTMDGLVGLDGVWCGVDGMRWLMEGYY